MADPERLQQLRAQRDLIAGHLAWLEREIAQAESTSPALSPPAQPDLLPATSRRVPASDPTGDPEELLARFTHAEEGRRPALSKSGCWLAFTAVLLIGGTAAAICIYFIYR